MTREISVVTTETILIRRRGQTVFSWCAGCETATEMVTAEDAAAAKGVSTRTLYRWVEDGRIHFSEPEKGILRVCLRSLSELRQEDGETNKS